MSNLTIGISTGIKSAKMSPGEIPCAVLSVEFIKLCNKFDAQAVIFPPQFNTPNFSLKGIDGLIITGGGDIDPSNYNEKPASKLERVSLKRDKTELNLLKTAEKENIKTLAICRGHQLLNIYKGGNLHQDIFDAGYIRNIMVFGDQVDIDLLIKNPSLQARKKVEVEILKAIHILIGINAVQNKKLIMLISQQIFTILRPSTKVMMARLVPPKETSPMVKWSP